MGGVRTDIPDRDIRVDNLKFPEGDDGADAVVPPGIQEADMQGPVNTDFSVVCAEHVKSVAKIESFFIAVPAPVGFRIQTVRLVKPSKTTFTKETAFNG